ncbi:MAG: hypothetical protein LW832_07200 [Parachlamydia sp.]|nr:hypothetical protein [Parachlamydia sp.]
MNNLKDCFFEIQQGCEQGSFPNYHDDKFENFAYIGEITKSYFVEISQYKHTPGLWKIYEYASRFVANQTIDDEIEKANEIFLKTFNHIGKDRLRVLPDDLITILFFPDRRTLSLHKCSDLRLVDKQMDQLFKGFYTNAINSFSSEFLPGMTKLETLIEFLKINGNHIVNLNLKEWNLSLEQVNALVQLCPHLSCLGLVVNNEDYHLQHSALTQLHVFSRQNFTFTGSCLSGLKQLKTVHFNQLQLNEISFVKPLQNISFFKVKHTGNESNVFLKNLIKIKIKKSDLNFDAIELSDRLKKMKIVKSDLAIEEDSFTNHSFLLLERKGDKKRGIQVNIERDLTNESLLEFEKEISFLGEQQGVRKLEIVPPHSLFKLEHLNLSIPLLTTLNLKNIGLDDLNCLSSLPHLKKLKLGSRTGIINIVALNDLTELKKLFLDCNISIDLSSLENKQKLSTLSLRIDGTGKINLKPLCSTPIKKLKMASQADGEIDFSSYGDLQDLKVLKLKPHCFMKKYNHNEDLVLILIESMNLFKLQVNNDYFNSPRKIFRWTQSLNRKRKLDQSFESNKKIKNNNNSYY